MTQQTEQPPAIRPGVYVEVVGGDHAGLAGVVIGHGKQWAIIELQDGTFVHARIADVREAKHK